MTMIYFVDWIGLKWGEGFCFVFAYFILFFVSSFFCLPISFGNNVYIICALLCLLQVVIAYIYFTYRVITYKGTCLIEL